MIYKSINSVFLSLFCFSLVSALCSLSGALSSAFSVSCPRLYHCSTLYPISWFSFRYPLSSLVAALFSFYVRSPLPSSVLSLSQPTYTHLKSLPSPFLLTGDWNLALSVYKNLDSASTNFFPRIGNKVLQAN